MGGAPAGHAVPRAAPLKNESWLDEDEAPVTPEQFRSRLVFQEISVDLDGTFTITFGDDDLFWGHAIHVSASLTDGPKRAYI
jgi:hypothetical protein